MKTPSSDLFIIIQSLSSSERRQFRAQFPQEGRNRTLELFELIAGMGEYDEPQIKAQIDDASFVKNLKVHKVRLQQQILAFLREHKTEKGASERVREQIDYLEILFERKLYPQAFDLAAKLEKQCEALEEYEHLLIILGIKARQQIYMQTKMVGNSIIEIEKCLAIISNYTYYAKISHQINMVSISADPKLEEAVFKLLTTQIIDKGDEVAPLSDIAARMRNYSLAAWRRLSQDPEGACDFTRANIAICQAKPKLYKEKPAPYFNILINHIISCGVAQKYDEALLYISVAEAVAANSPALEPHLMYAYAQAILAYKFKQEYQQAVDFFYQTAQPLVQKYSLDNLYTAQVIYINMLDIALVLAHQVLQKQCFEVLLPLTQLLDHRLVEHVLLLEMVFYIEAKEWTLLGHWVEALLKRMQRHKTKLQILQLGLNFAKKIAANPLKAATIIAQHQKQLLQLQETQALYYKVFTKLFDYGSWLNKLQSQDKKGSTKAKELKQKNETK